jgi:hypothetical protein
MQSVKFFVRCMRLLYFVLFGDGGSAESAGVGSSSVARNFPGRQSTHPLPPEGSSGRLPTKPAAQRAQAFDFRFGADQPLGHAEQSVMALVGSSE